MDECIDKNMIDKDEYPQSAEIENRCVHMLADLWNSPDAANTMGCSTTGSSEAAMLGGMAMKWRWREKMKAAGKPTDKPNMICGPVQICWHKFARYWDVELREIPMERRPADHDPGRGDQALRREHHRCGAHPGRYLHLSVRAGQSGQRRPGSSCRRIPGSTSPSTWTAPAAAFWRLSWSQSWSGISAAAGQVDQRLGSQVRPGTAGGGWVVSGATKRTCPMI
jgi:hypothetical protein